VNAIATTAAVAAVRTRKSFEVGMRFNVEVGRKLVGWLRRAKPESSKSRAFAHLQGNARIVTVLAVGRDEESRPSAKNCLPSGRRPLRPARSPRGVEAVNYVEP
jgi:hypothetical protein